MFFLPFFSSSSSYVKFTTLCASVGQQLQISKQARAVIGYGGAPLELYIRNLSLKSSSKKRNVIGYEGTIALTTLLMHSTTCHTHSFLLAFCATRLIKTIGSRFLVIQHIYIYCIYLVVSPRSLRRESGFLPE